MDFAQTNMTDTPHDPSRLDDPTAVALQRAVAGDFRLAAEIGRGGMGVVYRAFDQQLQRDIAIKTLPPHLSADAQVRSRFLREARTAAALSHPSIVPIFSAAERDAVVYFTMGLVDGESLAERIARDGPLPPLDVVSLLDELAGALGFAHARGIVHRDVKAENVLLDRRTGRAMVSDFGIARVAETQPLTATGAVLGTVQYMSPEQVSGDALDGRSDLYALGVLAFLSLTGRFPFERSTPSAIVVAHINSPPPRLRDVWPACPPVLEEIVGRLLEKSPAKRYPDADALRVALQDAKQAAVGVVEVREMGIPGTSRSEPVMLSSREAQEVWSRAAQLQANTGMITPPATFAPRGDQPLLTQGYDASLVKQSAVEAGIEQKYVDRALQEKAQVERIAHVEVHGGELMQSAPNKFLGARSKIEYVASIPGDLSSDDFEEIADEVRRALGEIVNVSAVGRSMTVNTAIAAGRQAGQQRAFQLTLTSRNGRTQVRTYEDLTNVAMGWFMGLGVGAGTGMSALVGGLVANVTHSAPVVMGAIAAFLGGIYGTARYFYGRTAAKRDAQAQDVLRRVIERARQLQEERAAHEQLHASRSRLLPPDRSR